MLARAYRWFDRTILAPVGFVVQDVVADAMTVEAVPEVDRNQSSLTPQFQSIALNN